MSLKTYIDNQVQEFRKKGNANILLGIQNAPTFKLLPIYEAFPDIFTGAVTSIEAVKINSYPPFAEIERISLSTNLIIFDSTNNQYVIDKTKVLSELLEECIYYLEFSNGTNKFSTEAFIVKQSDYPLTFDFDLVTWDSTLITFDQTNINI